MKSSETTKAPQESLQQTLPTGPAAAAILSAGIGVGAYGVITFVAQIVKPFGAAIAFYKPAGPLSGKTTLAIVVWLLAWAVLHFLWRKQNIDVKYVFVLALVLMVVGFIGLFPPVFEAFGG